MQSGKSLGSGLASLAVGFWAATPAVVAEPVEKAFMYQGQLKKDGAPVGSPNSVTCDLNVGLWMGAGPGGTELGTQLVQKEVKNGLSTFKLDKLGQFGPSAFDGEARSLEIQVNCPVGEPLVSMGRQEISPTPYALRAEEAGGGIGCCL
ncbi:MAG: hypothetical protein J5J06_06160 [Phycisphaerae bacterium]|nr:hypothetical protein [Phycisphaerae bacterium]